MELGRSWSRAARPNCPIEAWVSWIEAITPSQVVSGCVGYTQERIAVWIKRADAQKDCAIARRTRELKASFKKWLAEDIASGAAGAHKLVKAQDFIAPGLREGNTATFKQWANIWHDQAMLQEKPFDWQEQLVAFVKCASVGGSRFGADWDLAKKMANQQEVLEDIHVDAFLSAASSYPDAKAKGIDAWAMVFVKKLPRELAQCFCDVLNKVQLHMVWALQLLCNLISLIPKALGGQRAIAKTPMLYRLWNVMRTPGVKAWAETIVGEWDFAASGKSAMFSAAVRSWTNELGILAGKHTATILWDVDKFFDSIDPEIVLREGISLQYPPLDLVLALAMHLAPRFLVLDGMISACIVSLVSIIAGCQHSMFFARLVMYDPVSHVIKADKKVTTSTFVDDVAQIAIGSMLDVAKRVTFAGMNFARRVKGRKLKLSAKSVVVASNPRLARIIATNICKHAKVPIRAQAVAKDLGVLNNATAVRRTSVQNQRMTKALARCKRIAPLAKSVRRASVLAYTGALPQATWGAAAIGMAPTQVKRLTTAMAASTGIIANGRCPTTAIAVTMDLKRHPEVSLVVQQVSLWLDLWRGSAQLRALAARFWREGYERAVTKLQGMPPFATWSTVIGPMTATIAMLTDAGWDLEKVTTWYDPSGKGWHPDIESPKRPFLDLVQQFALSNVASKASLHWHGGGTELGVDWSATLALYKHIQKINNLEDEPIVDDLANHPDGDPMIWHARALIWLELLMSGGYWPQQRLSTIHAEVLPLCPRCGKEPEDAFHLLWTCECNGDILDSRVADTQCLVYQAREGCRDNPALWLRGLLPKQLVNINTPFPSEHECKPVFVGNPPPATWPSGRYHTDAGGGIYSSLPLLRRCGVGIVYLCQDELAFRPETIGAHLFVWGAHAIMEGSIHTVPRAELYAIMLVVIHAIGAIVVVTDSLVNVDIFLAGRAKCFQASNADLWKRIFARIDAGEVTLELQWSKGHADDLDTYVRYKVTPLNMFGNICADRLANIAAESAQVSMQDAMNLKWHYSIVKQIQARAVVILASACEKDSTLAKMPPRVKLPAITSTGYALATQHRVTMISATLHCQDCLLHSSACEKGRKEFLATPCNPNTQMLRTMIVGSTKPTVVPVGQRIQVGRMPLDSSHKLKVYKGLFFCAHCGYHASEKAQMLSKPCQPKNMQEAIRRVLRLHSGKLPSGMRHWPNESPDAPEFAHVTLAATDYSECYVGTH